nr:GyrI-like domain-containing protein [Kineococcus siccus]
MYAPPRGEFALVEVPPVPVLAVDGRGDPNTAPGYAAAVEALYTTAYTLKAAAKRAGGRPFVVAPLEGLWRAGDSTAFTRRDKAAWAWTMLVTLPPWTTPQDVEAARSAAAQRTSRAALDLVQHRTLHEGLCLQTLHVGPYDDEGPVLARLHDTVMPARGLTFNGDHHEIYLGDPRRSAPERLRTVLRQPVRPADTAEPGG